jgi:hypothetical protein
MKALNITTTGAVSLVELNETSSLSQMQAAVGGFIEVLGLTAGLSMVFDEEGKLKGRPLNNIAIRLTQHYAVGLRPGDMIVGDVLLIGNDDEGEERDVPNDVVDLLERLGYPLTTKA